MSPSVHFLFPVGLAGGSLRDLSDLDVVAAELVRRRCVGCGYEGWEVVCRRCGGHTVLLGVCERCRAEYQDKVVETCSRCGGRVSYSSTQRAEIKEEISKALRKIGEAAPPRLSGVRGLTSFTKTPETVLKGIFAG
jgi:DNA polymerase II large subunit